MSMTPDTTKPPMPTVARMVRLNARVSVAMANAIAQRAKEEQRTPAAMVRVLLGAGLGVGAKERS